MAVGVSWVMPAPTAKPRPTAGLRSCRPWQAALAPKDAGGRNLVAETALPVRQRAHGQCCFSGPWQRVPSPVTHIMRQRRGRPALPLSPFGRAAGRAETGDLKRHLLGSDLLRRQRKQPALVLVTQGDLNNLLALAADGER